jgi:hypothetical protein
MGEVELRSGGEAVRVGVTAKQVARSPPPARCLRQRTTSRIEGEVKNSVFVG